MFTPLSVLLVAGSALGFQSAAPNLAPGLYMTTMDATPIRTGPGGDYYTFMTAPKGTPVTVSETTPSGWARVPAKGPLFRDAVGVIRYPASESGRFEVLGDGTGRANGRIEVLVPNPTSNEWAETYGWICLLQSGDTVTILDSSTAAADVTGRGEFRVHQVALPPTAEVWINSSMLAPATLATGSNHEAQPHDASPQWMHTQPSSPLSNWSQWSNLRGAWIASMQTPVEPPVEVIPEPVVVVEAPPVYHNHQWESLEATITATPLHRLDVKSVEQLRAGYIKVIDAEATAHPDIAELATFRLRQLDLARTLNATRKDIVSAKARIDRSRSELATQQAILDESPDYVLRGKLTISPVFDGVKRPIFYRLQDPFSGRSLAYISPESEVDVRGMLGQRVGIVGRLEWNSQWQVTTVEPERVDLVSVTPAQ